MWSASVCVCVSTDFLPQLDTIFRVGYPCVCVYIAGL